MMRLKIVAYLSNIAWIMISHIAFMYGHSSYRIEIILYLIPTEKVKVFTQYASYFINY